MTTYTTDDDGFRLSVDVVSGCDRHANEKVAIWDTDRRSHTMHISPETAVRFATAILASAVRAADNIKKNGE